MGWYFGQKQRFKKFKTPNNGLVSKKHSFLLCKMLLDGLECGFLVECGSL